jgi:membrane-associated phospholipid phosphatase
MLFKLLAVLALCALPCSAMAQEASPAATASTPTPLVTSDTTFASLFTKVPPAFLRLGDRSSLAVLGTSAAVAALVFNSDTPLTRHAAASVRFDDNLLVGHFLGDIYFQGSVALGTYLTGYAAKSPRMMLVGADLVRAQLLGGFITDVTKVIVQRQRPNGANYSFPSGHTTSAFASAAVLQRHFGYKVGVPAYLLGGYVAASRMADNRHFPSDLLVGAAVGIVSGRAVTVGRGSAKFAVTPLVAPGGGGIGLTLVN